MKKTINTGTISHEDRLLNIKRVERARLAFEDLFSFYKTRLRNFRYYTGDQWSDVMKDPKTGDYITEEAYIQKQGRLPAKQNLIGKTIRNLAGQFRTNYPDPVAFGRSRDKAGAGEMMTSALQYALDINEATELDAQNVKEFGVSGFCGWKVGYKWLSEHDRKDVLLENIDTTRFFYNVDSNDVRGTDITLCGELHDMNIDEVINRFDLSEDDREDVLALFPDATNNDWQTNKYAQHIIGNRDFYIPDNPDKVRVIELWLKEYEQQNFLHDKKDGSYRQIDKEYFIERGDDPEIIENFSLRELVQIMNNTRVNTALEIGIDPINVPEILLHEKYEEVWNVYYLTPNGDLLLGMRSPYQHQTHPYIFGRYMMDGKILSLTESIIDQQRHVNRLISLIDAYLGTSLKNVKMIAEESVPMQYKGNLEEYVDDMVKMGEWIFYRAGSDGQNPAPKEISSKSMPAGALELLNLQSELLKDLSAVNDATQGKAPTANTPASLYAQQTINASITNKDIFDFYFSLIRKRNRKVVQVIKQFYDEPRYIKISGTGYTSGVEGMYEPDTVKDVDFDVVVGESQNTLAYRQTVDAELKEFLGAQLITFDEYLSATSMPYADKLQQIIRNRNQQTPGIIGQENIQELPTG